MRPPREIHLVAMSPGRDAEFAEMLAEFRAAGEMDVYRGHHSVAWQGYSAFYELITRMTPGGFPAPDIVPTDAYFIQSDSSILGEVYIRHKLSTRLEQIGGNVGYKVRPSARNRGVATRALRLALQILHEIGVERALLTCSESNAPSARVIEKCGGVRISDSKLEHGIERRYWIATL